MSEFLSAAKRYRELGLHPIPVEPRGKRPLVPWKDYQERQPTEQEIAQWWAANPDANVALVLGRGMIAVDVDGEEGEHALEEAGIELPSAAPISTTGKGRHIFLAAPGPVGDRVGMLPKVDIRGVGYVVAPPSIHPTGKRYKWQTSMGDELPPAPDNLLALIGRSSRELQRARDSQHGLANALVGVGEGQRDQTCTRLAGYFLGKGVPAEAVESLLLTWADRCTPPFPADQVTKCVQSIARREGEPTGPPATISDALDEVEHALAHPERRVVQPTGIGSLDTLLSGGFEPGDYIILAARPSVGKTALALQVARERAKRGTGALVVSREMTRAAIARRLLVQEAQVRASNVKSMQLCDIEHVMLRNAMIRLRALPMWITTSASVVSIDQIASTLAEFEPGQLGLVVVDYLQLVRPPAELGRDRRAGIEFVSQELKRLAVLHNVPVLCLSSLSRPPKDAGKNWRPQLSDLRESGELEHDADVVILLHRDWGSDICEANLAKQRDGRVDTVKLQFTGELLAFKELAA